MTAVAHGRRPKSATVALWLLAGLLVAGVVSSIVVTWGLYQDPPMMDGKQIPPAYVLVPAAIVAVTLVASALVLWSMAKGERWAFIVFFVVTLLSLPWLWSSAASAVERGGLGLGVYIVSQVADAVAVVLLLLRPARNWYGLFGKRVPPESDADLRHLATTADPSGKERGG